MPARAELLARYPEFSTVEASVLDGAIAEAAASLDATEYGDIWEQAVLAQAGHLLVTRLREIGKFLGATDGAVYGDGLSATLYGQEVERLRFGLPLIGFVV